MALTDLRDPAPEPAAPRARTSARRVAAAITALVFVSYLIVDNLDAVEFRVLGASYGISRGVLVVGAFALGVAVGWVLRRSDP